MAAKSGSTSARLTSWIPRGAAYFRAHLIIERAGKRYLQEDVPPYSEEFSGTKPVGSPLTVTDLDGDGEPEVLVDLYWGGVHCCWWSRIYRWDSDRYVSSAHLWGNFDYRLADLDKDRELEFVTADNRFAYAFTSFGGSRFPVQILTYRSGRLVDTTRAFPSLVEDYATRQWREYRELLTEPVPEVRGALAAWAADQCLLGKCDAALATLADMSETFADESWHSGSAPAYLRRLRVFLQESGYLSEPAS